MKDPLLARHVITLHSVLTEIAQMYPGIELTTYEVSQYMSTYATLYNTTIFIEDKIACRTRIDLANLIGGFAAIFKHRVNQEVI